ncbi:hypothetical protein OPV22_015041 [Ensete ventricosum]|uniref:Uncharacterized protein n=1 Tax=Ensete ventricosum TaxID=4639 RepID=A0AAV8R2Y1_ENSVE|nr:hypothetical protein OPV22_015041 [Ensete ventricosum]
MRSTRFFVEVFSSAADRSGGILSPRCWKSRDCFGCRLIELSIPSRKPVLFFASSAALRYYTKTNESLKPPAQVKGRMLQKRVDTVVGSQQRKLFNGSKTFVNGVGNHPLTGEEKRRIKCSGCLWDLLQPEIIKPTEEPHMPEHGSSSPPTIKTTGLHCLVSSNGKGHHSHPPALDSLGELDLELFFLMPNLVLGSGDLRFLQASLDTYTRFFA